MKMNYYIGGYYLIEGAKRLDCMNYTALPSLLFTPSRCICKLFPNMLIRYKPHPEAKTKYCKQLKLDSEGYKFHNQKIDKWRKEERFGDIDVFTDLETARNFAKEFLLHLNNIKLIGIATTSKYRDQFFTDEKQEENRPVSGIHIALQKRINTTLDIGFRGFDVLGYDIDIGFFLSYLFNPHETIYSHQLELNQHGLIPSLNQAEKALEYVIKEEHVLWQPWALIEFDI